MPLIETLPYPRKAPLERVAVFGAGGRMGKAVADYYRYAAPATSLRLIASRPAKADALRLAHPGDETVAADYLDLPSLERAFADVDGIFVVTPSGLDERLGMTNLIDAARRAGSVRQILRIVGYEPEATLARVPPTLAARNGDATQHFIAKALLDDSGLPVTFLNVGATLMDNFFRFSGPIRERDTLVYPPRYVPFIDVRDLGEVAARLFLSDDARHIGQFHTVNNGHDQLTTPQMAALFSDVLRRPIRYDGSNASFLREYGAMMDAHAPGEAAYRLEFFEYEYRNSLAWSLNDFAEKMLGRAPNRLRSWLLEHRHVFTKRSAGPTPHPAPPA